MPRQNSDSLNNLEVAALDLLLAGNDVVLTAQLRAQLHIAIALHREHTGVGQYTDITFSSPVSPIEGEPSFGIDGVIGDVNGVTSCAGFRLYIHNGLLHSLEIYAFGDEWPTVVTSFLLRHTNGEFRDLEGLRLTPGWPTRISTGMSGEDG